MVKKTVLLRLAFLLLLSLSIRQIPLGRVKSSDNLLAQAENTIIATYNMVLKAEQKGVDIGNLTSTLNLAVNLLDKAKVQQQLGNFTGLEESARDSISISSLVLARAEKLRDLAATANDQIFWSLLVFGSVSSVAICCLGFVFWRLYRKRRSTSILGTTWVNRGIFVVLVCSSLVVAAFMPLISMIYHAKSVEQSFIALGLLGQERNLGDYYPYRNTSIPVGHFLQWYVYVHNNMQSAKYIEVRVKLINSTSLLPDSQRLLSSSAEPILSFHRVLLDGEEYNHPFSWRVLETRPDGDRVVVTQLEVNNMTLLADTGALYGKDLYLVFELWVYDEDLEDFSFSWKSNQGYNCAWNDIQFDVVHL